MFAGPKLKSILSATNRFILYTATALCIKKILVQNFSFTLTCFESRINKIKKKQFVVPVRTARTHAVISTRDKRT